jgi:hypothetical protein
MAILGSNPHMSLAVFAVATAISASSLSVGSGWTAPSAKISYTFLAKFPVR